MATLAANVHVTDERGTAHVFGPADEVPTWAQALITNPKAWAEAPALNVLRTPEPAPAPKAPAKRAAPRRKAGGSGTVRSE
ncbi:hypothetical protein M2271_003533 [Streptomyces sp. LBL]|nr:hypothetical protein [Streptomyces sp. LBL]